MTENDYARHCLDYYASKQESMGDDGAKKISVRSESGVKECDSSVANELFGPMWDEINLKDGVVESGGRACDPLVNTYTSECTGPFVECLQFRMCSQHYLTFNIYNKGDCDFEYSDIGFCQEESLLTPCITANHQGNEQQITEGRNEEEITKGKCKII